MIARPICKVCNKNPRAPAYYRNGKRYYRSRCNFCINRDKKINPPVPKWKSSGYKKKTTCDLCGFHGVYSSQIVVFHIDGNLNNTNYVNLRSVCLCCIEVIKRKHFTWKPGEIDIDH